MKSKPVSNLHRAALSVDSSCHSARGTASGMPQCLQCEACLQRQTEFCNILVAACTRMDTRFSLRKASVSPHGTARQRNEGTPLKDWCEVPSTVHTTGRKVRELVRPMFLHGHKLDRTKLLFTILFCVVSCVPGDPKCPARPLGRKYLLLPGDM